MTLPRQVLPGECYFLTRRVTQRQFLLKPCEWVNQTLLYCLAVAAQRHGIVVMWFLAMSNHIHQGIYDPTGSYPAFLTFFHAMVARSLNSCWRRRENFWASEQASVMQMCGSADIFRRMIYTLCNPTKAHLVRRATEWPGVSSLEAQLAGAALVIKRPPWFFSEDGSLPDEVELRFGRPPGFEHLSQEEWAERLKQAIADEERAHDEERQAKRIKPLGRGGVLLQSHLATPFSAEPRRYRIPRLAARNRDHRLAAIARRKRFLAEYRVALDAYRGGDHDVLFPHGTYQLRVRGLVGVQPAPD